MTRRELVQTDFLVFLNRRAPGEPGLVPYRKDVARHYMRQVLYGWPESLAAQYAAIERLLAADVFELRYTCVDWAVEQWDLIARGERGQVLCCCVVNDRKTGVWQMGTLYD